MRFRIARNLRLDKTKKNKGSLSPMAAAVCWGLCVLTAAVPAAAEETEVQTYSNTDFAMDTVLSETLYTTGEDITLIFGNTLREMEEDMLSWTEEDSQISKLNAAAGSSVEVSDELAGYLKNIFQLSEDSGGAFDPTIGKIIRLWDIDGEDPHVPEQSELDELLADVGYEKVSLDENTVTLPENMTLDLGAVGKGIGCDVIAAEVSENEDVQAMILNLGGSSVYAYGEKPDGSDWRVALTDPANPEGDYLAAITLNGGEFLSTSGNYEKYFEEDGKRYHHILDPETGYPVWNGLGSVTVICDNGLFADGLSTACFVLGMEDALPLLEKYNADAAFVTEDGEVYLTEGMKDRFELMINTYTVKAAE